MDILVGQGVYSTYHREKNSYLYFLVISGFGRCLKLILSLLGSFHEFLEDH